MSTQPIPDKVFLQNYLQSINSLSLHKQLISGNGAISIDKLEYNCEYSILNIVYMHHGFYLYSKDVNHTIILVVQQIPICLYTTEYGVLWHIYLSPYILSNKRAIESRLRLACNEIHSIDAINLRPSLKDEGNNRIPIYFLSGTQQHMSHYLWNHLSALWTIYDYFQAFNHAHINIIDSSEIYGKISEIMPAGVSTYSYVANYRRDRMCLVDGLCIEPYYKNTIPYALTRRIVNLASEKFSKKHHPLDSNRKEINVCLAPRFGSRECINLNRIIEELLSQLSIAATDRRAQINLYIYISSLFGNNNAATDHSPKPTRERLNRINLTLGRSADYPNIYIQVLENEPVEKTLVILSHCAFVVSEWGASMALSSWILALPSIILAPSKLIYKLSKPSTSNLSSEDMWGSYINEANHGPIYLCENIAQSDQPEEGQPKTTQAFTANYRASLASFSGHLSHLIAIHI